MSNRLVVLALLGSLAACTTDVLVETADVGGEDLTDPVAIAAGPALIWPRVALGDYNQDVTTVQYLRAAAGKTVTLDGRFTAQTDAAVRQVQQAKGLVADGIVGEQTWLALLVEVDAGDSGKAVEAVQYLLKNR